MWSFCKHFCFFGQKAERSRYTKAERIGAFWHTKAERIVAFSTASLTYTRERTLRGCPISHYQDVAFRLHVPQVSCGTPLIVYAKMQTRPLYLYLNPLFHTQAFFT